ncbi:MAG: ATP-dependent helicase [Candidatus Nanopelagicales bacterium]
MTGILRAGALPEPAAVPDPSQARVISHGAGPLLVLGAPGTGKTETLVASVAARCASGVPADSIVVLAFGRAAAADLRERIALRLGGGALPTVTTFHGLALAIVTRVVAQDPEATLPRLLSGAEEDVRIRELLLGAVEDGAIAWPDDLAAALPTLGLANEMRALLARARELGVEPIALAEAGRALGRDSWIAAAAFSDMEEEVLGLENVVDYGRLVDLAGGYAHRLGTALRDSISAIYVDDAQECSPAQMRLLETLAGPRTCLVAFADPDVGIYGFRGADREAVIRLITGMRGARVEVLEHRHRGGAALRGAMAAVQREAGMAGLPAEVARRYRSPEVASPSGDVVAVTTYDSLSDLAAHVGRDLRERHVLGTSWASMAVLVRSPSITGALRRGLESAGVPVRVSADDVPLRAEPAVAILLSAIDIALHPDALTADVAVDLVTGPLCGVDPVDLRALGRAMRLCVREAGEGVVPGASDLLAAGLAAAIRGEPHPWGRYAQLDDQAALARVRDLGEVLAAAHRQAEAGALPGEVVWTVWEGTSWPQRLRRAAVAGHRQSHHDLDAVCALFDAAERMSDRYVGVVGVDAFLVALSGQRVPAERVAARSDAEAVTILTAHLGVGRSWEHVVIAGAQEGVWPPLRGRTSVLHVEQVEAVALGTAVDPMVLARQSAAERAAEERRLFVHALSRAERSVQVVSVASAQESGDQPSRFVDDLGDRVHVPGRPLRALTLDGLVADLRATAQDPRSSESLRAAAAERLARLCDETEGGDPLVPMADPSRWWGLEGLTRSPVPIREDDRPVALSASALEGLRGCPRRWFLAREARAEVARGGAMAFGSLVHVLADALARGDVPPDPDLLEQYADRVWGELRFDAAWQAESERAELRAALERLCAYHRSSSRTVLASEHDFRVEMPLPESTGVDDRVLVRGAVDRVERDDDGRVFLIDFKTGRQMPSGPEVADHVQLSVYQAAVRAGAVEGLDPDAEPGGAGLVHLRVDAKDAPGTPRVQEQAAIDDARLAALVEELRQAVEIVRAESFPAVASTQECRGCPYAGSCPAMSAEVIP